MLLRKSLAGWLLGLAVLLTGSAIIAEEGDAKSDVKAEAKEAGEAKPVKTVEAKFRNLTMTVPENWKQSEPTSRLRLGQFTIPKVEGDEEDAELAIFNFGAGGGVKANIDRWIGQFASEGRESKAFQGKLDKGQYIFVEITGTYNKPVGPPIQQKTELAPGSRMLGVILGIEDAGLFFLKMTGPDATVKAQADALRNSFGADTKSEKPVELE